VTLFDCYHLTDAGIIALSKRCAHLKVIGLDGCRRLTRAGVRALRMGCADIKLVHYCRRPSFIRCLILVLYVCIVDRLRPVRVAAER
jgi:hypothetical protein